MNERGSRVLVAMRVRASPGDRSGESIGATAVPDGGLARGQLCARTGDGTAREVRSGRKRDSNHGRALWMGCVSPRTCGSSRHELAVFQRRFAEWWQSLLAAVRHRLEQVGK
jgi:hypothetical protein